MKQVISIVLIIIAAIAVIFGGYVVAGSARNQPLPETAVALQSDEMVTVTTEPYRAFSPTGQTPATGFILYPGGLVPAEAYAPAARAIAAQGYLVVLPDMPLNLAVFSPNRAARIIAAYPMIDHWAVGGHSLGGTMAAAFVSNNPQAADGLVFWASYPADSAALAGLDLAVTSIYGTNDGLTTAEDIERSRAMLPPQTVFVGIEGGNHTQFGYYGDGLQAGDNPADISRAEQQAAIVAATVDLLEELDAR